MAPATDAVSAAAVPLRLGQCMLDLARGELLDAQGRPTTLRAQSLRLLCVLGERAGQVVGKDELLQRVWGDVVVTEDSLVQAVGDIRRQLGAAGAGCLRTVPRRGYCLEPLTGDAAAESAAASGTVAAAASPGAPRRARWLGAALLLGLMLLAGLAAWRWPAGEALAPQRSLAILPFEQDDPTTAVDAWFVDSITSDLNSIVAGWRDLRVVGARTMRAYKGKAVDPRVVARELGVAYVLAGRVRRDAALVNITVEMVHGDSGAVAWSQQFLVQRAELPRAIGDLAGGIAKTLLIEFGRSVGERNAQLQSHEVQADDLAMQAMHIYLNDLGPNNFRQAQQLFEQAVAKDPRSIRGLAGLSMTHGMSAIFHWAPDPQAAIRSAEDTLARLEAIDPQRQLTLLARATLINYHADWDGLLALSATLIERFPNDPTSHHHRCSSLLRLGRFDESIPACERALRISPRDSRTPIWHGLIGFNEYLRGRYEAAAERARTSVTGNSHLEFYKLLLIASLSQLGQRDEALRRLAEFKVQHPKFVSAEIAKRWPAKNAEFVAGRERVAATVRELGLP